MNEIANIWNTIVTSNTFNFIVMLLILGWICKKVDIISILEKAKANIVDTIEKSKEEKLAANESLNAAKKLVENLDEEISEQLAAAGKQGDILSQSISDETDVKISKINENIGRIINSEEKTISARLEKKTVAAAVSTAENHIKTVLKNSHELHDKYIQESLEQLDRIQL